MNKKHTFKRAVSGAALAILLMSSSALFAQVKIGTNPTAINAANNLEVEASTTGRKTSIDKTTGQVTIADGTQGTGKLLTSDVNGGASWQSTTALKIPVTAFTAYNTGSAALMTTAGTGSITSIPFTTTNPSASWNSTLNEYTIPTAGIYRIDYNSKLDNFKGYVYYNQWISLIAGGKQQTFPMAGGSVGWGISLSISGNFAGGEKVKILIASYAADNITLIADPMTITDATMIVTKIQ